VPFTLILADGEVISTENAGPYQYTPEGFNTGLATSSVPLANWEGGGGNFGRLYRTQPWVYTIVNKLVRQISRLPLKVYEEGSQPDEKRRVRQGPLVSAIQKPAPGKGPIHLKQWLAFPVVLHGSGLVRKRRPAPAAPPHGFLPLDWRHSEPCRIDISKPSGELQQGGGIDFWRYTEFTEKAIFQPDDVIYTAWEPPNGTVGVSPLEALGVTLRIERAAQRYQEANFRNSIRSSGALKVPMEAWKDQTTRDLIRADVKGLYQGVDNTGRALVIPGDMEWTNISHSAHEAELIEQRQLSREEVAAAYDIPPPMVGILDKATFSNITEQHKMLFTTVLGPWLKLIEETFKAQVIDPEPAFEGQWVEFELKEVLRGDPVKEAVAVRTELQSGTLTINEARSIQNRSKIDHPDCDRPMIPVNNVQFVGREPEGDPNADTPEVKALVTNLERVADRLHRRMKAGGADVWDDARFERELADDLAAAKAANAPEVAKAWTGAVSAFVADSQGDAARLRDSFACLIPNLNAQET
jgi:HK97 family phage portal protein